MPSHSPWINFKIFHLLGTFTPPHSSRPSPWLLMQKFSLSVLISLLACLGRPTKLKISLKMAFFAEWQKQKGLLAFEGLLKLPNDFAAKHDRDINYPLTMWQAAEIQLKLLTKATMKKTNEIRRSYTCNQMAMAQSHSQNSKSRGSLNQQFWLRI